MSLYCRVVNNAIVTRPSLLPATYEDVAYGFNTLDDETLVSYGFYKVITPTINATEKLGNLMFAEGRVTYEVLAKTEDEINDEVMSVKNQLVFSVQMHLDKVARSRNYDGILSLCSYEGDSDPVFAAEATAGKAWRSACWRYCYQVMDDVVSGTREVPTVQELLQELPVINW